MQKIHKSIANALEIHFFCIKPSICCKNLTTIPSSDYPINMSLEFMSIIIIVSTITPALGSIRDPFLITLEEFGSDQNEINIKFE